MKTPEAQHDDSNTAAAAAPAPTKNPNEEVIDLDTPIIRGEQKIEQVTLR